MLQGLPCEIGPGLKRRAGHCGYLEGFLMDRLGLDKVTGGASSASRCTGFSLSLDIQSL